LEQPACLVGEHLGSQNVCLRARKIRVVFDSPQDIIGHDALVMSQILPDLNEHGACEVTGKRISPVRSRILPSPILFKAVIVTKNSCSLDDFLIVELPIKRTIMAF